MESLKLAVGKAALVRALRVLGTNRRRRFSSVVPVWLSFDGRELRLTEDRGVVSAGVPAVGSWPAAGATVNLFALRRAADAAAEQVELIGAESAILVLTAGGYISLNLLRFGPESRAQPPLAQPDRHSDLPLFRGAEPRKE